MPLFKSPAMENIVLREVYLLDDIEKILWSLTTALKEATINSSANNKVSWQDSKSTNELIENAKRMQKNISDLRFEAEKEGKICDFLTPQYLARVENLFANELGLACDKDTATKFARRLILESNISYAENITKDHLLALGVLPALPLKPITK